MHFSPPPFSHPKDHLSLSERLELAPMLIPTIMFTLGIVTSFQTGTMPFCVLLAVVISTITGMIVSTLRIIRLRNRMASVLHISLIVMAMFGFYGLGWLRGDIKLKQSHIDNTEKEQDYRAIVLQSSTRERSYALDMMITHGALKGHKVKATMWRDPTMPVPVPGMGIEASSMMVPLDIHSPAQESGFHYDRWAFSHGFDASTYIPPKQWTVYDAHWEELGAWEAWRLKASMWQSKLSDQLFSTGGTDGAMAVAVAMTLGDKRAIPKDVRQTYSVTGAGHLLALSGWHLGLIYFLLIGILPTKRYRLFSSIVATIAVWLFVLVVGLPVSAERAAIMLTIYAMADVSARGRQSLNTVAVAALFILAMEPASCYDIGFQMSVAAVLGIALFYRRLTRIVYGRWFQPIAVSIAAQMGVGPIVALHFHTFSTYFILTNLVAMPIAMFGVYAAACALIATPIAMIHSLLTFAAQSACSCLNTALELIQLLPYSCIRIERMDVFHVFLLYVMLLCVYLGVLCVRRMIERERRFHWISHIGLPTRTDKKAESKVSSNFIVDEYDAMV